MRDALTREQAAALDTLKAMILDPATPALVLAVDVPFKAAMAGIPWPVLRALLDQRRAHHPLRPRHRARARRG